VWRRTPHEEIGVVERVLVDAETSRITAFVLRRKGRGGKVIQVPIEAVSDVQDGVVHVTLSEADLAKQRPYQPDNRSQ
jgi:sporulation protein YlmC with PRC-barrel domain